MCPTSVPFLEHQLKEEALPFGVYETPLTQRVIERIAETKAKFPYSGFHTVVASHRDSQKEASDRFVHSISTQFGALLRARLEEEKDPTKRLELINHVAAILDKDAILPEEKLLTLVSNHTLPAEPAIPEVSLNKTMLVTNTGNVNMATEITRESETADAVDLVMAFVKNAGIQVLHPALQSLKNRGIPVRVLTSTYLGASDAHAINLLSEKYGATVKIAYETKSTRLHAKAWLFKRHSGFSTAYVGSSNMSHSALKSGWEWNVRASNTATPEVVSNFENVFNALWNSPDFKLYDSEQEETLRAALKHEAGSFGGSAQRPVLSGLEVSPRPYQLQMLEGLDAERAKGRHKNLLVAATGTGKTVVSALAYQPFCSRLGHKPRLLFLAHRREILTQAWQTFREVLKDSTFGDLLDGTSKPDSYDHLFATVQSARNHLVDRVAPDHFDFIIIDEFHHASAKTYRDILGYFAPTELVGLTATPERADGVDIQEFFDYRIAAELRLWDALRLQLLTPMSYYGVEDGTDLSGLTWSRGKKDYDAQELTEFYVRMGDRRTKLIINQLVEKDVDLAEMKALGFCVTVKHAEHMAEQFNKFDIPAVAVSGESTAEERARAIQALTEGSIKAIFTVDLFNEGIDIPAINTLLMLRPTQSPVIFLQQLGRGLRLSDGKDVCIILDFIGLQNQEFDFTKKYSALTGKSGPKLVREVEGGFTSAPPGSQFILEGKTEDQVLASIKSFSSKKKNAMIALLRQERTLSISTFLRETDLDLIDIYRPKDCSWTELLSAAGLTDSIVDEDEKFLLKRVSAFLHVNDAERRNAYARLLDVHGPVEADMEPNMLVYARMLVLNIWANQKTNVPKSLDAALDTLRRYPRFAEELLQVIDLGIEHSRAIPVPTAHSVLQSHVEYSLAEMIASLEDKPIPELITLPREGVRQFKDLHTDLFLVTFQKNERDVSATTNYHDFPVSPDILHWESQSRTSLKSATAQRYIHHLERGQSILVATRQQKRNELGKAAAYTFLGDVEYLSHESEKPIKFEWKLARSMPAEVFTKASIVA